MSEILLYKILDELHKSDESDTEKPKMSRIDLLDLFTRWRKYRKYENATYVCLPSVFIRSSSFRDLDLTNIISQELQLIFSDNANGEVSICLNNSSIYQIIVSTKEHNSILNLDGVTSELFELYDSKLYSVCLSNADIKEIYIRNCDINFLDSLHLATKILRVRGCWFSNSLNLTTIENAKFTACTFSRLVSPDMMTLANGIVFEDCIFYLAKDQLTNDVRDKISKFKGCIIEELL